MKNRHRNFVALCAVAGLVAARSAAAQEPWVGGPPQGSPVVETPAPSPSARAALTGDSGADGTKLDHAMDPVNRAFEIELGLGGGVPLGAGLGEFENVANPKLRDIASTGGAAQLTLGFRVSQHWTAGVYGSGARYGRRDLGDSTDSNIWGASAGLVAEYHFRPYYGIDPFVSLASGWSGFWINPKNAESTSVQGWEMARVNIGVDFRLTRGFALAPVISGDATLFLSKDGPSTDGAESITKVNYFLFAGLQGRFDFSNNPSPAHVATNHEETGAF